MNSSLSKAHCFSRRKGAQSPFALDFSRDASRLDTAIAPGSGVEVNSQAFAKSSKFMPLIKNGVGSAERNDPVDINVIQRLLVLSHYDLADVVLKCGLPIEINGGLDVPTVLGLREVMARASEFGPTRVRPGDAVYWKLISEAVAPPGALPLDKQDPLFDMAARNSSFDAFKQLLDMRLPKQLVDILKAVAPQIKQSHIGSADAIANSVQLAMDLAEINTPIRTAVFLAQITVESDRFRTTREYASGADYEGRVDLGNVRAGDGTRFRGRGYIQITGRGNYTQCWRDIGFPVAADPGLPLKVDPINPEMAETLDGAARVTAWFWRLHGLNQLADSISGSNETSELLNVSIRINGKNKKTGLPNGWAERQEYFRKAKAAIGLV